MRINGIVLSSIIITNILVAVPNDIENESRWIGSGEVLLEILSDAVLFGLAAIMLVMMILLSTIPFILI